MVRMCGVTPPLSLVNPILDAIFEAIQKSPVRISSSIFTPHLTPGQSWRVRLKALPLVQGAWPLSMYTLHPLINTW